MANTRHRNLVACSLHFACLWLPRFATASLSDLDIGQLGFYGDSCPPDLLRPFVTTEWGPLQMEWLQVLTTCLGDMFSTAEPAVFAPAGLARTLYEAKERARTMIADEVYQEASTLTVAVFDIICLKAYMQCLSRVAAVPESSNWPALRRATRGARQACNAIDNILGNYLPAYITRASETGPSALDLQDEGLGLYCGGYFLNAHLFRSLLEEYRYMQLPRFGKVQQERVVEPEGDALMGVLLKLRNTSGYIIDLGAGLMQANDVGDCAQDPADCMCYAYGYKCILFEGDPDRGRELLQRYQANSQRVRVYADYISPDSIVNVIWSEARRLEGDDSTAADARVAALQAESHFPDLLKIDIDNGDCQFLETLLTSGIRPVLISMQIWQYVLPPSMAYSQHFNPRFTSGTQHQYESIFGNMLRGCSLGEVLRIVKQEYRVFALEKEDQDVILIHIHYVHLLPDDMRGKKNLFEMWEKSLFPLDAMYHENLLMGYPFPVRETLFGVHTDESSRPYRIDCETVLAYLDAFYFVAHYWLNRSDTLLDPGGQEGLWHMTLLSGDIESMDSFLSNYVV